MLNQKHTSKIIKTVKINYEVLIKFIIINRIFKKNILETRCFRYSYNGGS